MKNFFLLQTLGEKNLKGKLNRKGEMLETLEKAYQGYKEYEQKNLLLHIATVLGYIFPALYFFVRAIKRNIKHNAMSLYLELKSVEEKNMSFAK